MWASWREINDVAQRQLKWVYVPVSTRPNDEYFDDDDLPLVEVNRPLLPIPPPYNVPFRRSFWRARLSYLPLFIFGVILLIVTPKLITFLHLYVDPGYSDTFDPSYFPHPQPIEHLVNPVDPDQVPTLAHLQHELRARLHALDMPAYDNQIQCNSLDSTATLSRYAHLTDPSRGRTIIGLNLYNSGEVLPSIGRSLLELSAFLGPENVFISIFENGSSDNTTLGLAHLAAVLTAADIPHSIRSDSSETVWEGVDRIQQLAIYRNVVLEPLYSTYNLTMNSMRGLLTEDDEKPFENVLFINDVYFCPTDALELLHVRHAQQAHATCGMDYRWRKKILKSIFGTGPKFYDSWVARTLSGNTFRNRLDLFSEFRNGLKELFTDSEDSVIRNRFAEARVLPVYSCWNGMIALDARPFLGVKLNTDVEKDKMRPERVPVRFRGAKREKFECAASECKLVARDFWKRGFDRWVLVPYVRTTYVSDLYNQIDLEDLQARARGRWRSPPPSIEPLPKGRKLLPPGMETVPSYDDESDLYDDEKRQESNSTIVKRTWTYPSSPHPDSTPFDAYSFPSLFPSSSSPSDAPSSESDSELERSGEELDLIDWNRASGPEMVVCWPYHTAHHVNWWWTKVLEKVKKPLRHLK